MIYKTEFQDRNGNAHYFHSSADVIFLADGTTAEAAIGGKADRDLSNVPDSVFKAKSTAAGASPVTSVAGKTGAVTLTASDVGLGNAPNESKAEMFTSPSFTGTPTAPTAAAGTNTSQIATTAFVLENANSGRKYATVVIGHKDSGHTEKDVDFLCDGIDDQEEINAAIQALPNGGKILILQGVYAITGTINLNKHYITIEGENSAKSVLERRFFPVSSASVGAILKITGANNTVQNLRFDSDFIAHTYFDEFSYATGNAVETGGFTTIQHCRFYDTWDRSYAIHSVPPNSGCNFIANNRIEGCGGGVILQGKLNTIIHNYVYITGRIPMPNGGGLGLHTSNGDYNVIAHNVVESIRNGFGAISISDGQGNVMLGNIVRNINENDGGLSLIRNGHSIVSNNSVIEFGYVEPTYSPNGAGCGLHIMGSCRNIVSNNLIYNSRYGSLSGLNSLVLSYDSNYNHIVGNTLGKNYIENAGQTGNTFTSNKI